MPSVVKGWQVQRSVGKEAEEANGEWAPEMNGRLVPALQSQPLLPLDVGFVLVELREREGWPALELFILAKDKPWSPNGMLALQEFINMVLELPSAEAGFVLTYDVRELGTPQLDVIEDVMSWTREPGREAWHRRCACWKLVVKEGLNFQLARFLLYGAFYMYPPTCCAYLVTDPNQALGEDVICYRPAEGIVASKSEEACSQLAAPSASLDVCNEEGTVSRRREKAQSGEGPLEASPACASASSTAPLPPQCIDVGFAEVRCGFDEAAGVGYLKILGRDGDLNDEGLSEMMDFMDAFVGSANASKGFSITYDLRALRTPSLNMVMRVAEWGGEPQRKETWERLNRACKVVINPGIRFSLAKGVLSTFFLVCPPIVRTFLQTELDQPEDSATVFEPSPQEEPVEEQRDERTREEAEGAPGMASGAAVATAGERRADMKESSAAGASGSDEESSPHAQWPRPAVANGQAADAKRERDREEDTLALWTMYNF